MAAFVHPTEYRFYMQPYPDGDKVYAKKDIEQLWNCRYVKFTDLPMSGELQNVFEESFAENSGVKVYIPPKSDFAYKAKECKLTLLLTGDNCQERLHSIDTSLRGVKIEYSDTFRNRYATLLMTKAPTVIRERLYGNPQYMEVELTFSNILGKTFIESQI